MPPVEPQPFAEPCSAVGAGPRYVKPAKTRPLAATKPLVTSPLALPRERIQIQGLNDSLSD